MYNLARVLLMLDALREGDLALLAKVTGDRLHSPYMRQLIGGSEAADAARRAGAGAVLMTLSGALVAFAERNHAKIADAMRGALSDAGTSARSWTLPVDRQGVVISVAQTAYRCLFSTCL